MSAKTRMWVLLTGLVCAVIVAFGFVGGFVPHLAQAGTTFRLAHEEAQRNDAARAEIESLQEQQGRIDELASELSELRTAIPDSAESAEWLRELAAMEERSGARIASFALSSAETVAGDESASTIADVPVEMVVTGTDEQVTAFVRLLQTGERLVVLRSVDHTLEGDTWQARLEGVLYVARG